MTETCPTCGLPVGPGLGKIPGQCPLPGHGTHHEGHCPPPAVRRACARPSRAETVTATPVPAGGQQGPSGRLGPGTGQPDAAPPVLCARCVEHAGKPRHWCIWLVLVAGGRAAACECPCERRSTTR